MLGGPWRSRASAKEALLSSSWRLGAPTHLSLLLEALPAGVCLADSQSHEASAPPSSLDHGVSCPAGAAQHLRQLPDRSRPGGGRTAAQGMSSCGFRTCFCWTFSCCLHLVGRCSHLDLVSLTFSLILIVIVPSRKIEKQKSVFLITQIVNTIKIMACFLLFSMPVVYVSTQFIYYKIHTSNCECSPCLSFSEIIF